MRVRSSLFFRTHGVMGVVIDKAVVAYSCVALWISLSAGVILFNKYLLSSYGFPYPVALTLMHMGFCSGPIARPFALNPPVQTIIRHPPPNTTPAVCQVHLRMCL